MTFVQAGVSPEAARRQAERYRTMTPAEKLDCADALWELAWDATVAGVRMRHPDADPQSVLREARAILHRATD